MENAKQGNLSSGFSFGSSKLRSPLSQECSVLSLLGSQCQSFTPQCCRVYLPLELSSQSLDEVRVFLRGGCSGRECDSGGQALCEEGRVPQPLHTEPLRKRLVSLGHRGGVSNCFKKLDSNLSLLLQHKGLPHHGICIWATVSRRTLVIEARKGERQWGEATLK